MQELQLEQDDNFFSY